MYFLSKEYACVLNFPELSGIIILKQLDINGFYFTYGIWRGSPEIPELRDGITN